MKGQREISTENAPKSMRKIPSEKNKKENTLDDWHMLLMHYNNTNCKIFCVSHCHLHPKRPPTPANLTQKAHQALSRTIPSDQYQWNIQWYLLLILVIIY